MEWYEEEVRALERSRAYRQAIPCPVVFYGSSTLRLWSTLARDLGDARALNLAFGGSTLEACVYFFERLVPPEQPTSLVVYAGDNDLGDGRSPDQVLAYFRALAGKVERLLPGVPLSFISIKPSLARFSIVDRIRRANDLIRQDISQRARAHYISIFDAMSGADGRPRPELFLPDGLHLSPAGYRLWTELLQPYRNTIFTRDSGACNSEALSSGQSEPGISSMV